MNSKLFVAMMSLSMTLIFSGVSFDADAKRMVKRSGPAARGAVRHVKPHPVRRRHVVRHHNHSVLKAVVVVSLTASAFRARNCRYTTIITNGVTYYSSCGTWYKRGYESGTVVYIETSTPSGY